MSLLSEHDEVAEATRLSGVLRADLDGEFPEPVVEREPLHQCVPLITGLAVLLWLLLVWTGIGVFDLITWVLR